MRLDDGGLLAALHEGMFEQPLWHGFLEKLRARTGAAYAGLAFGPIDEERIVELHAGPAGPLHPDRLLNEKQGRDPPPYRRLREAWVSRLDELIEPKAAARQSYSREWRDAWRITAFRSRQVGGGVGAERGST